MQQLEVFNYIFASQKVRFGKWLLAKNVLQLYTYIES